MRFISAMDETTVRVEKTLESAIAEIDTPEKAKDVLHAIEREAAGQTEAKKGDQAKEAPPSAAAAVESAAARPAPSSERVAHTLVETAAQAVAKTPEAGAVIAAAQEVADTRHQITTPPDVKRGHELLERAVVEDMAPLDSLDARIFIAVNHLPHPRWLDRAADVVTLTTGGGWHWVGALLLARTFAGRGRTGPALMTLVPSLIGTTLAIEGPIKAYFRRRRPFIDIVRAVVVGKKPGNWSFPSGHSASSFAAARMLTCVWPKKWPLFYGVAVLVGFSRVYAGAHYPSDVLSGAVAGSVLSEAIRRGVGATAARACR